MSRVALSLVAVVWAAGSAAAEPKITIHGAGTASGGFTDNVLSAPDNPGPGEEPRESDIFTELAPSALVIIDTPRTLNQISYGVRLLLFSEFDQGNSLNHQADYRGVFLTTPLSQLTVNGRVRAGQTNALATDGEADGSRFGVLPFGQNDFIASGVEQELSIQLDPSWSVVQTGAFEMQVAGGNGVDTLGLEGGAGAGLRRTWRRTEIGVQGGFRYIDLSRDTADESFSQRAVLGDLRGTFGRDLGRRWNLRTSIGGRSLAAVDDSFSPTFGPAALASLAWGSELGSVSATVEHTLEPSLFVARNTVNDRAVLRGRLPLPWWLDASNRPRLGINGSVGVQRFKALALADNEVEASGDLLLGDLGATVNPSPDLAVTLRYQYRRQEADAGLAETLPNFTRSTVLLSVVGVYPRPETERRRSQSRRIDEREPVTEERP